MWHDKIWIINLCNDFKCIKATDTNRIKSISQVGHTNSGIDIIHMILKASFFDVLCAAERFVLGTI